MLKTGDVSRDIGVSPNTIREYVRRGWLTYSRMVTPTGMRFFSEEAVNIFKTNYMEMGVCGDEE